MSPKEMDAAILKTEQNQPENAPEAPFIIWGMGNTTESGYCYSIHIPERYGRKSFKTEVLDLSNIRSGFDWMKKMIADWMMTNEEFVKLGEKLVEAYKKFYEL